MKIFGFNYTPTLEMDMKFFEKVLRDSERDKTLEIEDFIIVPSRNINYYSSLIHRVRVQYYSKISKGISLIIKTPPIGEGYEEDFNFETEISIYSKIIPEMEQLSREMLAPRLIYYTFNPQPLIILEDMTPKHYRCYKSLLDYEDTKVVITKLAKWHATSYFLYKSGKLVNEFKKCDRGLFHLKMNDGIQFILDNMQIFHEVLVTWSGYEKYVKKFEHLQRLCMQRGTAIFKSSENGFNVLNHGDFHYNNFLVKKREGQLIKDVLFVDFQMSFWGSPAIDLINLLYLVPNEDTRENQRDDLINFYHQNFEHNLTTLGAKGRTPSLLDVRCELLKNGFLEVIMSVCFMPYLFSDKKQIDPGMSVKEFKKSLYENPKFKMMMEKLLPLFLHRGLLD